MQGNVDFRAREVGPVIVVMRVAAKGGCRSSPGFGCRSSGFVPLRLGGLFVVSGGIAGTTTASLVLPDNACGVEATVEIVAVHVTEITVLIGIARGPG